MNGMEQPVNKVLSCIVSYRDPAAIQRSLQRHKELIVPQGCQLSVIVFDNSQSPDVAEKLKALVEEFSATLIILPENLGVAGPYKFAAEMALKKGFQFLWLWDQDSIIPKGCLSELLQVFTNNQSIEKLGIVAPKLEDPTGSESNWITSAAPFDLWALRGGRIPMAELREGVMPSTFVFNSGALICAEMLKAIGAPSTEYFMDVVDFEYCARAYRAGWKILVHAGSPVVHAAGDPERFQLGVQFYARNHPAYRFYYMAKNEMLLAHDYSTNTLLVPKASLRIFMVSVRILFERTGRFKKLAAFFRGWWDGLRNIRGKSHPSWVG